MSEINKYSKKPDKLWRVLNSLGSEKKVTAKKINLKNSLGLVITGSKHVSNIFKDFFANIAKNLADKICISKNNFGQPFLESFYSNFASIDKSYFGEIDEHVVKDIIMKFDPKKSPGLDMIEIKFLKDAVSEIASPLSKIINLSLKTTFPINGKIAKVKMIHKKGSASDPNNFRPIALLSIISKIIEKVAHNQIRKHIDRNKIVFKYQSGFTLY